MKALKIFASIICTVLLISFVSCNSHREIKLNPEAPVETKILGKLAGTWDAEQSFLNRDGTWKEEKKYSIWKWYYILDGHAIQDDWIAVDSLNKRTIVGTNIRIFNREENKWHMAWIDKTNRRLATFTAVNENGNIIMDGTNAQGRRIKNTFFNISRNEFGWKQEWTFDGGNTWTVVTKMHCTRKS